MFIPDIGQAAGILFGAVVVVASPLVQAAENYNLGRCTVALPEVGTEVMPTFDGNSYLVKYHNNDSRYQGFTFNDDRTKVTLVKGPMHGMIKQIDADLSSYFFHYMPNAGYSGQDRFVMQVEKNGVKVRIQYLIEISEGPTTYIGDDGDRYGHYCKTEIWKISSTTSALDNASLQALLGAANIDSSVNVTFSDLAGGAVGQNVGNTIKNNWGQSNLNRHQVF